MTVRPWPLLILAAPAAVAVWSGWVGIGQMTGFGKIQPLPGIWNSLHLDTAVTLPIGVEAYAAFALRAWLTSNPAVSERTRRFARWSAIAALVLGMAGQAAYHLLVQAGVTKAPWEVTTLASCLPVLVLGMGSALAHLIRSDASASCADARYPAGAAGDREMIRQCLPDLLGHGQPAPSTYIAFTAPESGTTRLRSGVTATPGPPKSQHRIPHADSRAPTGQKEAFGCLRCRCEGRRIRSASVTPVTALGWTARFERGPWHARASG